MFRFLTSLLFRRWYYAFLFLYHFHPGDAGAAGFLFYQAIMFRHAFGRSFGFGLDCCCIQLYYSLCCYAFILLLASCSAQSLPTSSLPCTRVYPYLT